MTTGDIIKSIRFDKETAEKYLAEGNFFWNAGIFVWNVRTITSVMRV